MPCQLQSLKDVAKQAPVHRKLDIQEWKTAEGAKVLFVEAHELPMFDLAADVAHLAQERIDLVQAGHLPLPVLLQQCMGSAGAALLRPLVDGHECRRPVGNAHVRAADLRHQGATLGLVQEALQAAAP